MDDAGLLDVVLELRNLRVTFATNDGEVAAVRGVDLVVRRGETVAIVGESGSGKSQTMMAAMGLLARNGHAEGAALLEGQDILNASTTALNRVRGRKVTMIFQEPMTSLDPLFTIGTQICEPLRHHGELSRRQAWRRAAELLALVGIDSPEQRLRAWPHELSGGQRQRVMIAMAIANRPALLIADEPTTALDVTVQAQVLTLLRDLREKLGMSMVFITHDLGIVRRFADRVYVMRKGEVVEAGATGDVFGRPQHEYTRMLLDAEPVAATNVAPVDAPVLLSARHIDVTYRLRGGMFRASRPFRAVDDVSIELRRGQTLGIIGESGSGKSTLGRALLRLVPASGSVRLADRDLTPLSRQAMRPLRKQMQLVFQDPFGSLSPRMTIGDIITEGLLVHEPRLRRDDRNVRAARALEEVGLDPDLRNRYPHEFSGGQRQRIAIARALVLRPEFVVLDEPTSALDRSVQRDIVLLLQRLRAELGLTYLFISHDLAVVRAMSDEILVMRGGRVVESGQGDAIFRSPREAYTRELISAAYLERRVAQGIAGPTDAEM